MKEHYQVFADSVDSRLDNDFIGKLEKTVNKGMYMMAAAPAVAEEAGFSWPAPNKITWIAGAVFLGSLALAGLSDGRPRFRVYSRLTEKVIYGSAFIGGGAYILQVLGQEVGKLFK